MEVPVANRPMCKTVISSTFYGKEKSGGKPGCFQRMFYLHSQVFTLFLLFFCFVCSVDASGEDEALGRLVNHNDLSPNCEMRQVVCEGKPHLCLFAVRKIFPGDEITYRYGDSTDKLCSQVSFHTPHIHLQIFHKVLVQITLMNFNTVETVKWILRSV